MNNHHNYSLSTMLSSLKFIAAADTASLLVKKKRRDLV